ncbi:MAG: formate/nitrite transporter family protein [Clostridia bacterium]|nr:formate/nitrite transporter family protein [Clostridia bacterium]
MLKHAFWSGIASGMLVGIGGTVYLSCENKVVGAVLFSVALLCICLLGLYLYTGKIGLFIEKPDKKSALALPIGLGGNVVGAALTGVLTAIAKPSLIDAAQKACSAKLEGGMLKGLIAAVFCGVLMYAAVKTYGAKGTLLGIIFCIPTFILCGFEHSIADVYYFTVASMRGAFDPMRIVFILVAVVGNTLGGWVLPVLIRLAKGKEQVSGNGAK